MARGWDLRCGDLLDLPITLAEGPRVSRETVRVCLDQYSGRVVVDCRSWWRDADGDLRPGKGGVTLSVRHLPALAAAVSAALAHARSSGHPTGDLS